jgi:hypothetical protein
VLAAFHTHTHTNATHASCTPVLAISNLMPLAACSRAPFICCVVRRASASERRALSVERRASSGSSVERRAPPRGGPGPSGRRTGGRRTADGEGAVAASAIRVNPHPPATRLLLATISSYIYSIVTQGLLHAATCYIYICVHILWRLHYLNINSCCMYTRALARMWHVHVHVLGLPAACCCFMLYSINNVRSSGRVYMYYMTMCGVSHPVVAQNLRTSNGSSRFHF